jgi:2-amino-4-hydroxy-6-hydroxymethyldihydropteridine diphosphokinase
LNERQARLNPKGFREMAMAETSAERLATPTRKKIVYLSLGSNLGKPQENLRVAIERLKSAGIDALRVSSFYRTEPVEYRQQPWFVNCVVEAATEKMPMQLLKATQALEREMGRKRVAPKGPRIIDIDILLYGNVIMRTETLTIPHPALSGRRFVLVPLRELAPDVRHPGTRRTVAELWAETSDTSSVQRLEDKEARK